MNLLETRPKHLPAPCIEVTVLEVAPEIMGAEDSDAAALIREVFREDPWLRQDFFG